VEGSLATVSSRSRVATVSSSLADRTATVSPVATVRRPAGSLGMGSSPGVRPATVNRRPAVRLATGSSLRVGSAAR
jgi:hypothetical protein